MTSSQTLKKEVSALDTIIDELNHFYSVSDDFEKSAEIRAELNEVEEIRFVKKAQFDALTAGQDLGEPVSAKEQQDLAAALSSLDKYVRSDQSVAMCISYLTQIANEIAGQKK
jgi:hypothetical protein